MMNVEAYRSRQLQRRWAGLTHVALACFMVLVLVLGGLAFTSLWGLFLVLPVAVGGYCLARSAMALRTFRRAMAEESRAQRVL